MAWYPNNSEALIERYGANWMDKIKDFYGPNSDVWQQFTPTGGEPNYEAIASALDYMEQVKPMRSVSGKNLGVDYVQTLPSLDYADPADDILAQINSNSLQPQYGLNNIENRIPSNFSLVSGTDTYSAKSGTTKVSDGSTIATVADKVKLAEVGTRLGAKLGLAIDETLYAANPEWWDEHFPAMNPEWWQDLAGQSEVGDFFLRELLGIEGEDLTSYISEEALAYTYMMLRDLGAFGEGVTLPDLETTGQATITGSLDMYTMLNYAISDYPYPVSISQSVFTTLDQFKQAHSDSWWVVNSSPRATSGYIFYVYALDPKENPVTLRSQANSRYKCEINGQLTNDVMVLNTAAFDSTKSSGKYFLGADKTNENNFSYSGLNGVEVSGLPGTSIMDSTSAPNGYPNPNVINGTTKQEVIQQLRDNCPWLYDGSITEHVLQDDGSIEDVTYISTPSLDASQMDTETPTTGEMTQTNTNVSMDTLNKLLEQFQKTPNPENTGEGKTPSVVLPTGSASSLWAVYHPSQSQLNAFGAWLWSSDFVEQIKKLFMDPMQAIIGVHKVFAPIPTGGSQNIKCGYLDSGVSSPTVSSQYTSVDCGTVKLYEYFGNVFDYDPHTKVSIYLPFIGVVPLKVSEVMRSSISVNYGVDVITGACLAKVSINRDGAGGILYTYGGSCACHYPISSGSYAGIISGIVTSAVGIATGIATGNPLAAVGGAIAGVKQMHTEVQHSGGFTGCAGAMGPKKPYLIVTRPQTKISSNVENFFGIPSNSTMVIGDCVGYVRVKHAHVIAPSAYDEEVKEIETLLQNGVIISN